LFYGNKCKKYKLPRNLRVVTTCPALTSCREGEGEGEGERERDPNKPTNTQLHFGWFEEVVIKYPRRILLKRDG